MKMFFLVMLISLPLCIQAKFHDPVEGNAVPYGSKAECESAKFSLIKFVRNFPNIRSVIECKQSQGGFQMYNQWSFDYTLNPKIKIKHVLLNTTLSSTMDLDELRPIWNLEYECSKILRTLRALSNLKVAFSGKCNFGENYRSRSSETNYYYTLEGSFGSSR